MLPEEAGAEVLSAIEAFRAGELGFAEARGMFSELREKLTEADDLPAREFLLSVVDAILEGLGSIGLGARFFEYVEDLLGDPSVLSSPPEPMTLLEAFHKDGPPCAELYLARCEACGREFPAAAYDSDEAFDGFCEECGRLVFLPSDDPVRVALVERAHREHGEPEERLRKEKARLVLELVAKYNRAAGTDPDGSLDVPEEAEKEYHEELRRRLDEARARIGGGWRDLRIQAKVFRELSESLGKCPCEGNYLFSPPPPDGDWDRPVCPHCLGRARAMTAVSRYRYADEHGWSYVDRRR